MRSGVTEAVTDRAAETRAKLLAAAGPVFAERGWQDVTVREICGLAGVNVAAINYHFGDKAGLYLAAVRDARERRASQFPFPEWPEGTPPERRLHDFIRTILLRMLSPEACWQTRLLMREVLQPSEACRSLVDDYFRPDFELLVEIVGELLPPGAGREEAVRSALSVMGQCVLYRVAGQVIHRLTGEAGGESGFDIDGLVDHVTRFSLPGCMHYGERSWDDDGSGG